MVTCQDGLAPIKSHELLITLSFGIMWQTKPIISPFTQWLSTPNLAGWWITARGFYPSQPHDSFNMWTTWGYVAIWKIYISPSIIFMAINIDKVLTPGMSFSTQSRGRLLVWFEALSHLNYFLSSLQFLYCNVFENRFRRVVQVTDIRYHTL